MFHSGPETQPESFGFYGFHDAASRMFGPVGGFIIGERCQVWRSRLTPAVDFK